MAGSATAFGRLEFLFLGPFRLQLLHMKMKKVVVDFTSGMKNEINFEDVLSIPWSAALARIKVTNKGKDIKKNDSTFERHDQFITALQSSYLVNLFDNYQNQFPDKLASITNLEDIVSYVWEMLESFDIQLFFDPDKRSEDEDENDDSSGKVWVLGH